MRLPSGTTLIILFFGLLYALFPTANSTSDAIYYAASAKYAENLFLPHHLFFNALGLVVYKAFGLVFNLNALSALKLMNALAAGCCLGFVALILKKLGLKENVIIAWLIIAGSAYGLCRFATESETYILPLLCSLAGSYYFLKALSGKENYFWLAGFWATIGCLFHQIHIFWLFGLVGGAYFYQRSFRHLYQTAVPGLLIPLVYLLVLKFDKNQALTLNNLLEFVLHDAVDGQVQFLPTIHNFILTPISFIRSWLQVHGNMLFLIRKSWLWLLPAIISSILLLSVLSSWRQSKWLNSTQSNVIFLKTHFFICCLHLLFAFYALGNAEFMVMLPLLSIILIAPKLAFPARKLALLGLALLIWNFFYGIFPNFYFLNQNNQSALNLLAKSNAVLFITHQSDLLSDALYYQTGRENYPQLLPSPSLFQYRNISPDTVANSIAIAWQHNIPVYTDCLRQPKVFNRSSYLITNQDSLFFAKYHTIPIDSAQTLYGWQYIYRIEKPL